MRKIYLLLLICLLIGPFQSNADAVVYLWNQQPNPDGAGIVNQEFPSMPEYSTYIVNDFSVGSGGWNINTIFTYYDRASGNWPANFDVRLNIFSKSGALPLSGNDPASGTVYQAVLFQGADYDSVEISGLNIYLPQGQYWMGMTPILTYDGNGQEFQIAAATLMGDFAAIRNPGEGFNFGTGWVNYDVLGNTNADGAFAILGTFGTAVPEPATMLLLGLGLAGIAGLRKRL